MIVFRIFKKLQLFYFAFVVAISCGVGAALIAGKIDHSDISLWAYERANGMFASNPDLLGAYTRALGHPAQNADRSAEVVAVGEFTSLQALRQRQKLEELRARQAELETSMGHNQN